MNELTQEGIKALKIGNKIRARNLLKMAIRQDPKDVQAWLWLSGAVDSDAEKIDCLQSVLRLDPGNKAAAKGLAQLQGSQWVPETSLTSQAEPETEAAPESEAEPEAVEPEISVPETVAEWQPEPTREPETTAEPEETLAIEGEEPATSEAAGVEKIEEPAPVASEWDNYDISREDLLYQGYERTIGEQTGGGAEVFSVPEPEVLKVEEVETTPEGIVAPEVEEEEFGLAGEKPARSDKILKVGGPSFGYGTTMLIILLIVLAAVAAASTYFLTDFPYSVLLGAVLAIVWIVALLVMSLTSLTTRYILTRRKLILESGVLGRKTRALPLEQVNGVQPTQGALQKLAKVADITLTTSGEEQPMKLKSLAKFEEWLEELTSLTASQS